MRFDETRDNMTDIENQIIEADIRMMDPRELDRLADPNDPEYDPIGDADTEYDIEFDGGGYFNLSEIPEDGVTSIDLFDAEGRQLFSLSVSTNGVAYQVLQRGEELGLSISQEDEI
jgi:hypothetical protein